MLMKLPTNKNVEIKVRYINERKYIINIFCNKPVPFVLSGMRAYAIV